jgi:hypothetical protein
MILEYAQLLCTAHRILDGTETIVESETGRKNKKFIHPDPVLDAELYGATHRNHPSAVWVREHAANYNWVLQCMMHLNLEYKKRYGHTKNHLTIDKIGAHLLKLPHKLWIQDQIETITPPPQCVADDCHQADTVRAYRDYYNRHKAGIARWKNGEIPSWFAPTCNDDAIRQISYGIPLKAVKEVKLDAADEWLKQNDPDLA